MTKPRRTHTDSERAQDALAVVSRQLDRARTRRDKAKTEHDSAQADVTALEKRAAYLRQDPALPAVQTKDTYVEPVAE